MGALVVAAALAVAWPATASTPSLHTQVDRYRYDGSGTGVMVVDGTIKMAPGAVFAIVFVDLSDPRQPAAFFPQVVDLSGSSALRTYGAAGDHTLCAAPVTCSVRGDMFGFSVSNTVSGDGRHPVHLRFYLAVRGPRVTVHDRALVGWTARHRSTGLLTRTDSDATGAGVDADGVDAGAMLAVSAPRTSGASIALAVPGCDVAGAGAVVLSGGPAAQAGACPTSEPVTSYSPRSTAWSVKGAVAGVSQNQTRLLVLAA